MKQVETLNVPAWWQRIQYITRPVAYWERAYQVQPEAFWAKGIDFGRPLLVFYTPAAAQQIIENRQGALVATTFESELKAIFGDSSFFTLEGIRHQQMRKLLIPQLHGKHIQDYAQIICNLVDGAIQSQPHDQPFSVLEVTQDISLQVMISLMFGAAQHERYQRIQHLMLEIVNLFASNVAGIPLFFRFLQWDLGSLSPWGRFLEQRQQMRELITAEIAQRRDQSHPHQADLLSLLMSATDQQGHPLTDAELIGQVLSLLFTAYESTAASIAWSWYQVYAHREIKAKLCAELEALGTSPDPLAIVNLPYLSAVCNETLRMYPVTMFMIPRLVKSATTIGGYYVKPNTLITVGTYVLHHREDLYPNPHTFNPDRFLSHRFSPYEFLPFGGGMRGCIGGELALYQLKLAISIAISRYALTLTTPPPVYPQRRNTILVPTQLKMRKQ